MVPMTAEQRAQVNARLDELAAEVRELARQIAMLTPPSPASVRPLPRVAA
jgi:cell division protein FtsB